MNPYALSGTAPSRRRVYLFHHLGDPLHITGFGPLCKTYVAATEMGVGLAKRCRTLVVAKACVHWPAGAAGETQYRRLAGPESRFDCARLKAEKRR